MKKSLVLVFLSLLSASFFGCESKYVEKSPDAVKMSGPTLEARATQKIKTDLELAKFQIALQKISSLVTQIGGFLGEKESSGTSIISIAESTLKELQQGIPQHFTDELLARYSTLKLSQSWQSDCESLDVGFSSYPLLEAFAATKTKRVDRFGFFFKSCHTNNTFKPLFLIDTVPQKVIIKFNTNNLKYIDTNYQSKTLHPLQSCEINYSPKGQLTEFECKNIIIRYNAETYSLIKNLKFSTKLPVIVAATILTFRQDIEIGEPLLLTIDNTGHIKTTAIKHELLNEK